MHQTTYKLGIITPLASEGDIIDELIERVLKQIPENAQIFYILDNACKDNTKEKVQEWMKRDSRVIYIWAPENRGPIDAYFRGYREALNAGCDYILEMDGGLSHQPEEIPRFLEKIDEGFECIAGSRFIAGSDYIQPGNRAFLSKSITTISRIFMGSKMQDMTSGFECFSRQALEFIISQGVYSRAHFWHVEIRTMMQQFKWVEVPISYRDPSKSVGSKVFKDTVKSLLHLLKKVWFEGGYRK